MRNRAMNTNGILGITAATMLVWLLRRRWTTEEATPMSSPTITAIGRLRSLAAMTAAKAAAISKVYWPASKPMTGAARTPAKPAMNELTAQTPTATDDGLVPD